MSTETHWFQYALIDGKIDYWSLRNRSRTSKYHLWALRIYEHTTDLIAFIGIVRTRTINGIRYGITKH